jgi:hypothetical protein
MAESGSPDKLNETVIHRSDSTEWGAVPGGSHLDADFPILNKLVGADVGLGASSAFVLNSTGIGQSLFEQNDSASDSDMQDDWTLNKVIDNQEFISNPDTDDNRPFQISSNKKQRIKRSLTSPYDVGNPAKRVVIGDNSLLVLIKGKNCNITEKNPIKLKKFLLGVDSTINTEQISYGYNSLKIQTSNESQKIKFLGISSMLGEEVLTYEYNSQDNNFANASVLKKVIIFGVHPEISNDDIKSETGASNIKRLEKNPVKGEFYRTPTTTVILGFTDTPPERVYIGLLSFKTRAYQGGPIRCFKCQRFGHVANSCKGKLTCPRCSLQHDYKDCPTIPNADHNIETSTTTLHCPNCKEDHSAGYRGCSAYIKAKSITEIKYSNKISYADALKIYTATNKQKDSVKENPLPTNIVNIQKQVKPVSFKPSKPDESASFGVAKHVYCLKPYLSDLTAPQIDPSTSSDTNNTVNNSSVDTLTNSNVIGDLDNANNSVAPKVNISNFQCSNKDINLSAMDAAVEGSKEINNSSHLSSNIEVILQAVLLLVKLLIKSIPIHEIIKQILGSAGLNLYEDEYISTGVEIDQNSTD